jgi:hypothetical protein
VANSSPSSVHAEAIAPQADPYPRSYFGHRRVSRSTPSEYRRAIPSSRSYLGSSRGRFVSKAPRRRCAGGQVRSSSPNAT